MPGYSSTDDALATKLVSYFPNNTGLPTHQAWVMLFDPSNGSLLAVCMFYVFMSGMNQHAILPVY